MSPSQSERDLQAEREARWLMEDLALAAREQLRALAYASYFVPIKQHDRSQEEQQNVESFTAALIQAREWLRAHGMPVPGDVDDPNVARIDAERRLRGVVDGLIDDVDTAEGLAVDEKALATARVLRELREKLAAMRGQSEADHQARTSWAT
jgi:hypothetical protein